MESDVNETPYELQERLKREQGQAAIDQTERQAADKRRLEAESSYVPPTPDWQLTPADVEARNRQQKADDEARAAAHQETLLKDRIRRAFLSAGGVEADFEEQYPGLRKRHIAAQTMSALNSEAGVGEANADGTIRW
jgi:hypothetical protein